MKKRSQRLNIFTLPYLQQGLARTSLAQNTPGARFTKDPLLMWVTEQMTVLAYEYAPDLPEWDFDAATQSSSGIIIWEGSTGLNAPMPGPVARMWGFVIQGIVWVHADNGTRFFPLGRSQDVFRTPAKLPLVTPPFSYSAAELAEHLPRLWAMLGTTLILSDTPTVAAQRTFKPPPPGPTGRAPLHSPVTKVMLRENLPTGLPATKSEGGEKKWGLKKRHLVRGHWRAQVCGPGRADRRPTFVPPYIKGPADAPLVVKPRVHVWGR
ncbi:MAG: hypothetical protein QP780_01000 [Brevibacterium sp. UMB1308B]|nr:hypothetical protein [Brevibacterium sp. UMB1308B]